MLFIYTICNVYGNKLTLPYPAGSSAHAMAQWVGQRPHKNSRTRRTNVVSPVIKHSEIGRAHV